MDCNCDDTLQPFRLMLSVSKGASLAIILLLPLSHLVIIHPVVVDCVLWFQASHLPRPHDATRRGKGGKGQKGTWGRGKICCSWGKTGEVPKDPPGLPIESAGLFSGRYRSGDDRSKQKPRKGWLSAVPFGVHQPRLSTVGLFTRIRNGFPQRMDSSTGLPEPCYIEWFPSCPGAAAEAGATRGG